MDRYMQEHVKMFRKSYEQNETQLCARKLGWCVCVRIALQMLCYVLCNKILLSEKLPPTSKPVSKQQVSKQAHTHTTHLYCFQFQNLI